MQNQKVIQKKFKAVWTTNESGKKGERTACELERMGKPIWKKVVGEVQLRGQNEGGKKVLGKSIEGQGRN